MMIVEDLVDEKVAGARPKIINPQEKDMNTSIQNIGTVQTSQLFLE